MARAIHYLFCPLPTPYSYRQVVDFLFFAPVDLLLAPSSYLLFHALFVAYHYRISRSEHFRGEFLSLRRDLAYVKLPSDCGYFPISSHSTYYCYLRIG